MKVKFLCLLLSLLMILPLVACGSQSNEGENTTNPGTESQTESQTETETETETGTESVIPSVHIGDVPLNNFVIIYPTDVTDAEMTAIKDMQTWFETNLGYALKAYPETVHAEHEIVIGQTQHHDTPAVYDARLEVKEDGYAMLVDDGNLYITGAITNGTINGIYDFMQNYGGVRYYSHSFTGFRTDGVHDVPADLRIVFNPVFLYRNNYNLETFYNRNNHSTRTKHGGTLSGGVGGPHNMGPRSKTGTAVDAQPCLSDETVYENVLASVMKDAEKGANVINVCQNDSTIYCRCDACAAKDEAAGSHMGSLLMFINRIADAVKEAYPERDIKILTLAYEYSEDVPNPEVITPRDNVIIQLCVIRACFNHAFADPECEVNTKTYKNLSSWSKVCDQLYVWDYAVNDSDKNSVGPNLNVLWDNMQTFRDCNVIGQFQNGFGVDTGEFLELRSYLIGQLLWNPNITKEQFYKLWDEFMEDYYGAAAPYVKEYIDLVNNNSLRKGLTDWDGHTAIWCDSDVYYAPIIDGVKDYTSIDKCIELWDKAMSCVLTPEQYAHVERSSLHFWFWMAEYGKNIKERAQYFQYYQELSDKYTYDHDELLPAIGEVEGVDPTVPSEGLEFHSNGDGTCFVKDTGSFTGGLLVIPATSPAGDKVTAIGKYAFSRCTNLVEVIIPEGVTSINAYAFRDCLNLTTVTLPASLTRLDYGALGVHNILYFQCTALTTINFGGTMAQWEHLNPTASGIDAKTVTVHCTDGDILPVADAK